MTYKYMRDSLEDKYGFLKLQDKVLEIAVYIDKFCYENDIKYCLMGGSALGAKRHGGFIPWDDDLDIFMTVTDYENFRKKFFDTGDKEKYYLQQLGYSNGMITTAKIRMNETFFLEESIKEFDIHHGIYIDIFILHVCPKNKILQLWQCLWAKYVIAKGIALRKTFNRHTGIIAAIIKIVSYLPARFLLNFALKQVYLYDKSYTGLYANFLGKAKYRKGIYKSDWFDNPEYVSFEKVKLKAPAQLHDFLSLRFGDYTKIPSQERIKYEQHASIWKDRVDNYKKGQAYKDENKMY